MKLKGLFALFSVVLALFIWLHFFEKNFKESSRIELLHLDPTKVTDITIVDGNNIFSLKRNAADWILSTTPPDRADTEEVTRLLDLAALLKPFDRLHTQELKGKLSLSELGLQNPHRSITFYQEGAPEQIIYFGNEAIGEKSLFAKTNTKQGVSIIPSALADHAFRNQDDFRDQKLTPLELSNLTGIQLHQQLGDLSLFENQNCWHMSQPIDSSISETALKNWITPLLQAPILARIADDDTDLARYGLDQPRAEIMLFHGQNLPPIHLWLGSKTPLSSHDPQDQSTSTSEGEKPLLPSDRSTLPGIYVRSSARKAIFKLPASLEQIFFVTPDSLKDQDLFTVNLDTVDKIVVTKKAFSISLRHQVGSGDAWITEGSNASLILGSNVQKLVDTLEKIPVLTTEPATPKLLADCGLDTVSHAQASIRFIAHLSENTPDHDAGDYVVSEVFFGAPLDHPESKLYARVNNKPTLHTIPTNSLEKFDLSFLKK